MRFVQIINQKKFTLISILFFMYLIFNFLDGERGLISYFEKKKIRTNLVLEKKTLLTKLAKIEKKNDLLTNDIDLDYLEILYRKKFIFGKPQEKIYIYD